jgi:hypothetical protein
VALITIVCDEPSPEHVLDWMSARGYDFPVLWDDGYSDRAEILGTPENWVLDRQGRMVFNFYDVPGGWAQEVQWMVEAVLEG